jgi:uncharacterized protein YkwD
MSVIAVWRALLAAVIVVCVLEPSAASASPSRHDATEAAIVKAMNGVRAQYGLAALRTNTGLARAADAHSASMLRSRTLSHGAFGQRVRRYVHARGVGENLAWMNRCNADQVVRMWLNSAAHRRVMLSRSFARVGVARRASSSICFITADFSTAS